MEIKHKREEKEKKAYFATFRKNDEVKRCSVKHDDKEEKKYTRFITRQPSRQNWLN